MRVGPSAESTLAWVIEPETPAESSFASLLDLVGRERVFFDGVLHRHGAVLMRGFDVPTSAEFARFAQAVGPSLSYAGGDAVRGRLHGAVYESSTLPPDRDLSPHNEKAYSALHPRFVMFYCMRAASAGGETPLVDGRNLLTRIDGEIVEALERRRVTYVQNLSPLSGDRKSWQETFETGDASSVERFLRSIGASFRWGADRTLHVEETVDAVRTHPVTGERVLFCAADRWHVSHLGEGVPREALLAGRHVLDLYHHATFGDGGDMPDEMLGHIRRAIRAGLTVFTWRERDVLVVDNLLTLHGRASYRGERAVAVAMC